MIGSAEDGTVLSYLSILQMTISELLKALNNLSSVKVVVIYSKQFTVKSTELDKVLVPSIYRMTY